MECAEDKLIEELLREMTELRDKMSMLGEPISDRNFAIALLTALPGSWDMFISSIDLDTLRFDTLEVKILEQDRRKQAKTDGSDSVLAAKSSKSGKQAKFTCFRCGKPGHIKRNCPDKPKDESGKAQGQKGQSQKGRKPQAMANAAVTADATSAPSAAEWHWMAQIEEVGAGAAAPDATALRALAERNLFWYADSGATSHIAQDRSLF